MSRVLRPFLMFPRNGDPAFGSAAEGENLDDVIKDFRPANVVQEEVKPVAQEIAPKVLTSPDSSATGSVSDSPDGDSTNSSPSTDQTQTPQGNGTSPSESSEQPATAAKARLLHPSSTTTGKPAPPAPEQL